MSDSDESGVTYTEISSTFEELSDIGSPRVVPSPDYIPGHEEPQSPHSLDYVLEPIYPEYMPQEDESDPEADPEEDDDEDPEEDPVDYPADGGDDGDDKEGSSEDDEDDDIDIEAMIGGGVARLLAISTPPSSPLSPWSSPLPQIPSPLLPPIPSPSLPVSPPLPVSSPVPVLSPSPPASPIRSLGYQTAMIRLRAEAASTSHSLPLPPPFILSNTRPAAPSSGTPPLHLLSTNPFETRVRQDMNEIYTRLDDEQSQRQLLAGRLNMLFRDRRAYAHTRFLMETEARMSQEAWEGSMGASDLARAEVISLRTTVLAQQSEIREL
ncbi:hypothetical protein Tco_0481262 [Tanacetum coccineum]